MSGWNRLNAIDDPAGPCVIGGSRSTLKSHWQRIHGRIPKKLQLNHRCDQPLCRNLGHVWLGTQKENVQDSIAKGRFPVRPNATLTEADVHKIRKLLKQGQSCNSIAKQFGVNHTTIDRIKHKETWASLCS